VRCATHGYRLRCLQHRKNRNLSFPGKDIMTGFAVANDNWSPDFEQKT